MISNPFEQQVQAPKKKFDYGDPTRFTALGQGSEFTEAAKVHGSGGPLSQATKGGAAQGIGSVLGSIGEAMSQPEQEEPMPELPQMQPGGIGAKPTFQMPQLEQLRAGLGQAAIL